MISAEINEKEMKEITEKINKTKNWFFEKRNKIYEPLARIIKNKREKNQINRIRNEKRRAYNRQCGNTKDYKRLL